MVPPGDRLRGIVDAAREAIRQDGKFKTASPAGIAGPKVEKDGDIVTASGIGRIMTLEQFKEAIGLDESRWYIASWSPNTWTGFYRAGDSHRYVRQWQVKARVLPIPDYLRGVDAVNVRRLPSVKSAPDDPVTVLIGGDPHFGFEWDIRRKNLRPYHDERALALFVEMARIMQPDHIRLGGDMLDLAVWSTKFLRRPEQAFTTQPAMEALHRFLVALRKAAPRSVIKWTKGNHDERIEKLLAEKASEILTLLDVVSGEPLIDLSRLLHLADLDVELVAEDWVDGVHYSHGETVRKGGGSTAAAVVQQATSCEAFFHVHRRERGSRTIDTRDGQRELWAISPGCLCHIDGRVPHAGRVKKPDWQQGAGLVTVHRGDPVAEPELFVIDRGRGFVRGQVITA